MACEQYQEQFTDFLEGALPEPSWRELELHLQQCEQCAAAIKDFRRTVSALRGLALVEPPRTLVRAIGERMAQEAAAPVAAPPAVRVRTATRRGFPWSAAGALAAACLVVAVVAVYSVRRPSGPLVAPPPAPGPSVETAPSSPPAAESGPAETSSVPPPSSPSAVSAASSPAPRKISPASRPRSTPTGRGSGTRATAPAAASGGVGSPGVSPPAPAVAREADSAGPAGPAGAAAPTVVPSPKAAAVEPSLTAARTFGESAPQRGSSGPVSMDIKVSPPGARQVGEWGPLSISLTAGGDVPQVSVRLVTDSALQVQGSTQIYSGPLQARRPQRLTVQVRAQQPGSHRLKVVLASDTPIANTSVDVYLRGYAGASAVRTTQRCFRSVPLGEAVEAIGKDCGLQVEVEQALARRRVSADFSTGVSGVRALRVLAGMVGGKLSAAGDGYRIVAAE